MATYLAAFGALCSETEPGRRLSNRVLPEVDATTAYESMRSACTDPNGVIRQALAAWTGGSLVDAVANVRPGETLAGAMDGQAVVSVVLALLLFEHDERARVAQRRCCVLPRDELEEVCRNTDTNPLTSDPDPVQRALVSFLAGDESCLSAFAAAAYGRAADYGTKPELADVCSKFLHDCSALLEPEGGTEQAPPPPPEKPGDTAQGAAGGPRARPTMVDRSTSPPTVQFYNLAKQPFSSPPSTPPPSPSSKPPSNGTVSVETGEVTGVDSFLAAADVSSSSANEPLLPLPTSDPKPSEAHAPEAPGVAKNSFTDILANAGVGGGSCTDDEDEALLRALEML
jgi:hypothetical protein